MNKYLGSKLAAPGVNVEVCVNDEVVDSVANKLAITMCVSNDSISQVISKDEAKECFKYALNVVLCQCSGAKTLYEVVPNFLSDIVMPLNAVYRSVRINVAGLDVCKRPHSYATFLDVLTSIGVPAGKVLKVDSFGSSNVMKFGVKDIAGEEVLVGVESEATIEELVVRAMLTVSEMEQEKLNRVLGHMDNMYVSMDELVRHWACSLPVGKRG